MAGKRKASQRGSPAEAEKVESRSSTRRSAVLLPRSVRGEAEEVGQEQEQEEGQQQEEEQGQQEEQEADPTTYRGQTAPQASSAETEGDFVSTSLKLLATLRGRLGGGKRISLPSSDEMELRPKLQQVQHQVEEMIADVVDSGQSNSILLLGDRGSGKTALLQSALKGVQARFPSSETEEPRVGIVRLNGLVTCDDRTVFKELASQLCSLCGGTFSANASYEENLSFLKEVLEEIGSRMAVVFVLDELDAFARRTKQVVLYNLFDALQSPSVVACVVGLSCRHDAVELLEKRVQSRFSHRKMLVQQPQAAQPAGSPEKEATESDGPPPELLQAMLRAPSWLSETAPAKKLANSIKACTSDRGIQEALTEASVMGVSPRWLADVALLALSRTSPKSCTLETKELSWAINSKLCMDRGQADLVTSLSVLQLYLLVGLCRLERKECERSNFQAVFQEYTTLQRANDDGCERFARASAMRAFEELAEAGMINYEAEYGSKGGSGLLEYQPVQLLLSYREVEAGLKAHTSCPSILPEWLKKESVIRFSGIEG